MKILGIDYGSRRIGLAISDESLTLARELEILHPKKFWAEIKNIIQENQVTKVVLGLPIGVKGNDTETTMQARAFSEKLKATTNLAVEFIDERFSSAMAKHLPGGNNNVDSLAAQILLQNYLDKQKL